MSGLFGRFRDFVQRRTIYLATTPFAGDAGCRLRILWLDAWSLFNEGANQLGLEFHQTETLVKCVLRQDDVIIDASRVQKSWSEELDRLTRETHTWISIVIEHRLEIRVGICVNTHLIKSRFRTLNNLIASLCIVSEDKVVNGDEMQSLEWSSNGFRHTFEPENTTKLL